MEPILTLARFDDVDGFAEWEAGRGWTIESTQLSEGPNRIEYDHLVFPDLVVGQFRLRRSMHSVFTLPADTVLFDIRRRSQSIYLSGHEVPAALLPIVRGATGREYVTRLPAGWDSYEFITNEAFLRRARVFPSDLLDRTEQALPDLIPLVEPEVSQLLRLLDTIFDLVRNPLNDAVPVTPRADLLDVIVAGLRRLVRAGLSENVVRAARPTRRADLMPVTDEFMRAHLADDLTAEQIAAELGVSYRVLHYAVEDAYGVSPAVYLRDLRLHAVRRLLKTTDQPIAEVGLACGFHSASRLASQYCRLFGELPSATRAAQQR